MTFRGNPDGEALYMFRSYDHFSDNSGWVINPGPAAQEPIWEIARATTAAPTYFSPITIGEFIYQDAGIGRNNPSLQALFEVIEKDKKSKGLPESQSDPNHLVALLISIGTGKRRTSSRFSASSMLSSFSTLFNWVKVAVSLSTDADDTHIWAEHFCVSHGIPYFRFNVDDGLQHIGLDDNLSISFLSRLRGSETTRTLDEIEKATRRYLAKDETQKNLQAAANALIATRRPRAPPPITPLD